MTTTRTDAFDVSTATPAEIGHEVNRRLARTINERVAETGEAIEVAARRVTEDFAAQWPIPFALAVSVMGGTGS